MIIRRSLVGTDSGNVLDADSRSAYSVDEHGKLCRLDGVKLLKGNKRHGPIDTCPIAQFEGLATEYLEAAEGSPKRERMERRFGRVNLRRLIAQYEEEKVNMQWLNESTTKCPGCQCYVEKSMGCNHVRYSFLKFFILFILNV